MVLTPNDLAILQKEAPRLTYNMKRNVISGRLSFKLCFGDASETLFDEYQIEIDLNNISPDGVPVVRETGGRIRNLAQQKGIPPLELHLGQDDSMCMIIPPKEKERYPNGFDLKTLIHHIQEHLYWISYFDRYEKEPWKAYGHGNKGYLELYFENHEKYGPIFKEYFHCTSRPEMRRKIRELRKEYKI